MKNRIIYSLCLTTAMLLSVSFSAQTKKIPEPDLSWKVYFYDEKANEAVDMENGILDYKSRSKGYAGIGTTTGSFETPGEKSAVRISKKQTLNFLMKIQDPNFDITREYYLLKLVYNPKTKQREMVTNKSSSWSDKYEENFEMVRYTNSKAKEVKNEEGTSLEYIIRMISVENLEPGEYVWTRGWGGTDAVFFGVD